LTGQGAATSMRMYDQIGLISVLRLSRKADYALIAMQHLARLGPGASISAADIATQYGISVPLLAKILQRLAKKGLVVAHHGASGGYSLARDAGTITALEVISAIDGPIAITSCTSARGECDVAPTCTVRAPLEKVNEVIVGALNRVTVLEMADAGQVVPVVGRSD